MSAALAPARRTKLALRLRQAELRLRAASMRCYAARLQIDAEAIEPLIDPDDETATLPQLELVNAQQDAARFALEAEWLRKEIAA